MKTVHGKEMMRLVSAGVIWAAGAVMIPAGTYAQVQLGAGKIEPWVLENTRAGAQAEFFVVPAEQANLSGAKRLQSKLSKGRMVYRTLRRAAERSQKEILAELDARGVEYRSYYLVNAIWVRGDRSLAQALAARPDVQRIDGNPAMRAKLPEPHAALPLQLDRAGATILPAEPGVSYVRAPQVWSLGFTGQGVVVGGADTGYRWTHVALKRAYRGWNGISANHDYNWHDAIHSGSGLCGANSVQPCDDLGHGTHTMGTTVGADGANRIGVAPGAKWIGCRNMSRGSGTPASYLECMEFFLAPYPVGGTPSQGDPSKAPDVTVNSWACAASEGCTTPNLLLSAVANLRAAGILMEVSAGNSGPDCATLTDQPTFYDPAFSTGALDTGTDTASFFSSRGPVTVDGSGRVKPDIMAPGTDIRSAYRTSDRSYGTFSGSSMAGPHVAGGAALVLSAFPALAGDVDALESRLTSSAKPILLAEATCGSAAGAVPNNVYGYGRLDLGCAVPGKVSGSTVVSSGTSATLTVDLVGPGPWTLTWSDGLVQSGVATSPATRSVSPASTTTYTLTSVSSPGCNQPGAGSATVTVHP